MNVPSPEEVERIAVVGDPALRNLQITWCYHRIAVAMAERTGPGANWCAPATWASKQAGRTIRHEDLQHALDGLLRSGPVATALQGAVLVVGALFPRESFERLIGDLHDALDFDAVTERTAEAVARGNLKVFAEIAPAFARYLAVPAAEGDAALEAAVGPLRRGPPPEGQDRLRSAFVHYEAARHQVASKPRAELLFLANAEIGAHEQTRLQPEIAAALDAPIPDAAAIRQRIFDELGERAGSWLKIWLRLRRWFWQLLGRSAPLDAALERVVELLRPLVRRAVTDHLMVLTLPRTGVLRLGTDLALAHAPELRSPEHRELIALLAEFDPTPDSVRETGATDWADFAERIHFIVDLFRCIHTAAEVLEPPFTAEQASAIVAGRVPQGPL